MLPSDTVTNPKEQVNVVTTRNNYELYDAPMEENESELHLEKGEISLNC